MRDFWGKYFLWLELMLAVIGAVAVCGWAEHNDRRILLEILGEDRSPFYGAFTSVVGSMLGFTISAAAILLGFADSPALRFVRNGKAYSHLWEIFTSALWWLGIATAWGLIAIMLDRKDAPRFPVFYATIFLTLISGLRVWRSIWVLEKIIFLFVRRPSDANS
jgi:hypothetical protein